jgi:hypothetical protein
MNKRPHTYILPMILLSAFAVSSFAQNEPAQSAADSTSAGAENAADDSLMYSHPTYIYDTLGKQDPFQSQVAPEVDQENTIKDLFSYEEANILGIVSSGAGSYALMNDVNGASYVLRVGDRVLGGRVEQITDDAVIFDIVKYARAMTIIMRLESSKYTVYEEIDGESRIRRPGINITYGPSRGTESNIIIDEVSVPSLDVKFIEEEWFGPSEPKNGSAPEPENDSAEESSDISGVVPLLTPHNKSWVTLPYAFEWLNPDKIDYVYTLIIYDDSDLNNPVFIEHDIETTTYLLAGDTDLPPNKDLYWEVIAHKQSGNERLNMQTVMSFKIKGQ